MALNSQGCLIRRISTVANTTGSCSTDTLTVDSTARIIKWSDAAADFVAARFVAGQRITITGSTHNIGIYTVSSATSTSIGIYGAVTAVSSGVTLTLTANRYDNIGGVKGFNGPSGAANVIDITDLNSTAKKKLIGLRDEGQCSLDIFLETVTAATVNNAQVALKTDRANRTLRQFDIMFSDSTATTGVGKTYPSGINFDAYVSGFTVNPAVDNAITGSITLEITSALKYIPKV